MDRRRKILTNSYEVATHEALHQAATKHGAQVFPKVRIADALAIQASGLTNEEYSYALKAHFDFIVAREDGAAAFAVEFDGPQHDREPKVIAADVLKNAICEKLGMPLLRIDAPFLRPLGRFTLLGWLVEVWFLAEAFDAAQAAGSVPYDEVFHYSFVLGMAYREGERWVEISDLGLDEQIRLLGEHETVVTQPYDPFLQSRALIMRLHERGACRAPVSEEIVGTDPLGYVVALAVLPVSDERVLIGQARVRSFRFSPVGPHELAVELSVVDAAEKLKLYRQGKHAGLPPSEVDRWRARITQWNEYR